MSDDLAYRSAAELAAMIRARQVSPIEVARTTLDRIQRSQPILNAFITIAGDQAMAAAHVAEEAVMSGAELPPLHGVPFSAKDLVPTAGLRTTYGSLIFKDHVPTRDATVVARLKRAGAILIGKTTTPEFGQQSLTQAPLFGRTRNAWSAARTSGGSSGGAAVAVASGLGPIAVASDGGGSTRIPAACNGLVGFKQSLGVTPQEYAQDGFGNISFLTPMTRTVLDTALMLEAMAGPDPLDPLTVGRAPPDFMAATKEEGAIAGVRIAWRPRLGNSAVAAEVLAACEEAMKAFASLGAVTMEHAGAFENPERLWYVVNSAYRRAQYGDRVRDHRDIMCPTFLRQFDSAETYSAADLYAAIFARTRLFRQVQSWFETCDIVAMPTLSRTALPIDQDFFGPIEIDGEAVPNLRGAWYPYTMPFNLTGNPAVSLPCGFDSAGLPIGIQLVARCGEDALLLRAAAAFERAKPWAARRPILPGVDRV
jgi:aspartyl-tRNA(Asn)/glutamyl-tRNA(Gln) amidotransferase subunit A